MMRRASSTDSVVCVTKARLSRIAHLEPLDVLGTFDQVHAAVALAHRAFDLRVALRGRSSRSRGPASRIFATSTCTLVTSGQVASNTLKAARLGLARTACDTPCALKIDRGAGRHLVELLDEHRALALAGRRRRTCCARPRGARRSARRSCASARSTISIARSTPAQKPRGLASRTSMSDDCRLGEANGIIRALPSAPRARLRRAPFASKRVPDEQRPRRR